MPTATGSDVSWSDGSGEPSTNYKFNLSPLLLLGF